jgi:hypothetical protein
MAPGCLRQDGVKPAMIRDHRDRIGNIESHISVLFSGSNVQAVRFQTPEKTRSM